MHSRLQHLRSHFEKLDINAFLVSFLPHLRYLSGFSGSSGLGIVTKRSAYLITDGRYTEQIKREVRGWEVFIAKNGLFDELKKQLRSRSGWRIGFDGNTLLYAQFKLLKKILPGIKFLPKVEIIDALTAIKDDGEIQKIKRAVEISDRVFIELLNVLKPGITELEIAAEITYRQRKLGAEGDSFEAIVASSERSALPHGHATRRKIRHHDWITLDFGCVYEGYRSDLTRTIAIGNPHADARKIYNIVLDAQERSIEACRSGMKAKDLDAVARDVIKNRGYGEYFQHSLGHGLGLQVHEAPRIAKQSKATLETGNVVTIEPGIYLPGFGGVRIEDVVVVADGHCDVMTRSPKELIVL